jgi:beta-glucosidase
MYDARVRPGHSAFPPRFLLGASTAAYQIEGAASRGGRGPSIWDTFSHTPGKTADGATGDVAAGHYDRLDQDLDLMEELHLGAYRFSISWPRVMPTGEGLVNDEGIQFYSQLVDGLLARGIAPVATLNHWDLPQALEDKYGGWRGRQTAYAFEKYAELMGTHLGDRVAIWSTHNEPWNNSFSGYGSGAFAPGGTSHADALAAAHHLNLSHGLGVQALRRTIQRADAQVSVALNIFRIEPESEADVDAARLFDAVANRVFTGPMLHGEYPADLLADTAKFTDWGFIVPGDLEIIHQPLDLLGVNYYEVMHVRESSSYVPGAESAGGTQFPGSERVEFVRRSELERTAMDWGVEPRGLEDHLVALSAELPDLPIMVMENGAAFPDVVETSLDGSRCVLDIDRTRYIAGHVNATHRAIERGANVVGYIAWSLLDNFEWTSGYRPRFGIVYVDYRTLERTPKLSAHWLATLCDTGAIPELVEA